MKRQFLFFRVSIFLLSVACFTSCNSKKVSEESTTAEPVVDYALDENWAYLGIGDDKPADLFIICPTVYSGDAENLNMSLSDEDTKANFTGALNMERGIYDEKCRLYAPFYRQASLLSYVQESDVQKNCIKTAYTDIRNAFVYYLENLNNGRPFVLAGFSQGSELSIMLMKDMFSDKNISSKLIATYAIGWRLTKTDTLPHLVPAKGENDTGCIVSFNSEAEHVTDSMMVPKGMWTYSINPLNWKTDSALAAKSYNKGACFTDYDGKITKEIPELCSAYIDSSRGTLKVPDVSESDYPPVLSLFTSGIYHLYDYQFFYRNLQENVAVRVNAYLSSMQK